MWMSSAEPLREREQKRRWGRDAAEAAAEQKREEVETNAEPKDESRGRGRSSTEKKPAELHAMLIEMREPELAGEARSFIGSAQQQSALGDCRHAHTAKGAHLAPLTPLTGAAHARGCIRRAREQRRLCGALQARGA